MHPRQLLHMSARKNQTLRRADIYLFFYRHDLLATAVTDGLLSLIGYKRTLHT